MGFNYYYCRRDSFITHRAFCDALARESVRQPPPSLSSAMGNQLYGSSTMPLALAQSSDPLRLGSARTAQFDHILPPPPLIGSPSFRPSQQTMHSSSFFIPDHESNQNQNYHLDQQQGLVQNEPLFQGLIQLSDINNNHKSSRRNNSPSGSTLFNLSFLSGSGTNSSNNNNSSFPEHFNNAGSNNLFSIMGDHIHHQTSSTTTTTTTSAPSLFSTSLQSNSSIIPHMSATALLQKAAQMGATSSNNNVNTTASSLLRSFGSSTTTTSSSNRPLSAANYGSIFGGNNNLQDMMNSFAAATASGNSSIFASGSSSTGFEAYDHSINRDPKLQTVNIGGSDNLTRDFLGVGQIMRSMSGGVSHREQQQRRFNLSSLETERNTAPSDQSFGGGENFQ